MGVVSVDRVVGVVHVEDEIDTGIVEQLHTFGVVLSIVDRVDTNGIDTKVLESLDIPCACIEVCEGIDII